VGIQECLSFSAKQFANRIAFVENDKTISYQAFFELVKALQSQLVGAGVLPSQVVAVKDDNSIAFAASLYAVMGIGAVALPVYHLAGSEEWLEMLDKANVHWVFENSRWLSDSKPSLSEFDVLGRTYKLFKNKIVLPNWKGIENPAFIRFTSGTTGFSKGVLLSEESIWGRIDSANVVLQLSEEDTVLWVLPMAFHFVVSIMLYLKFGCKVVLCNSPFPAEIAQQMREEKASFFYGSPLHIKMLSQSKLELPVSLKWVISTSSGVQKHVCESFYQTYGIPVAQAYGIIEFGLPLIHSHTDPTQMDSVGFVTPGYEVEILDENYQKLSAGKEGKLAIRGKGRFEAYLLPWKPSEAILTHGWFFTGDIALKDEKGRFFIKGREKSMVNLSGLKVFPEEVEEVISRLKGVKACKVFGKLDSRGEEELWAEIVLQEELTEEKIKLFCRESLALYKIPKHIKVVPEIGETLSGKIKR
jgi:long-chain acyl-CoA synthetase